MESVISTSQDLFALTCTKGVSPFTVSGFSKNAEIKEEDWKYDIGRLTFDMAKTHIFPPSEDRLALFCGPPPMITYACEPFCKQMGYTDEQIVIF